MAMLAVRNEACHRVSPLLDTGGSLPPRTTTSASTKLPTATGPHFPFLKGEMNSVDSLTCAPKGLEDRMMQQRASVARGRRSDWHLSMLRRYVFHEKERCCHAYLLEW